VTLPVWLCKPNANSLRDSRGLKRSGVETIGMTIAAATIPVISVAPR
jgi:hypothetical protein